MGKNTFSRGLIRDSNEYVVSLTNVHVVYHGETKPAIYDVNLKVGYGEFILITGPNGAGKTTLLETIIGLLKPCKGRVVVFGKDVSKNAYHLRKLIGYVPQDFIRKPEEPFLVREVVALALACYKGTLEDLTSRDWERVHSVLRLMGIEDLAYKPIGRLSGGQQQKVMIARAIVRDPKLLLLDEPFSNLDPESRVYIANLLSKLNEKGVTVIMVSHDTSTIPDACSRVIEMRSGRIVNEVRIR